MAEAKQDKVLTKAFNKKLRNLVDKSFWAQTSIDDSAYVTGYDKIIIPQFLDAIPHESVTGATDWNAQTMTSITHTSKEYSIDTEKFGPVLINVLDTDELLYDKGSAVMEEMMGDVNDFIAEKLVYNWTSVATNNVIPTTGSVRSNRYGNNGVKALTRDNWMAAQQLLDEQKIPRNGRVALMNARFYTDLKNFAKAEGSDIVSTNIILDGQIGSYDGVSLIQRETDNVFAIGGTALQPFGTAPIATDLAYCIIYHPKYVRRSVGTSEKTNSGMFIVRYPTGVVGKPSFEAYVRVGGAISYEGTASDDTGVVTIVESV